ncbi:MAG: LptA/OstA family protein [Pseudomonadota bacterium]
MALVRFLLIVLCAMGTASAQLSGGVGFDTSKPSEIDAERVERKDGGLTWVGEGAVRVSQPGVVLTADKMIISLNPETNEIDEIEALGRVRYANVEGDAIAGDYAKFMATQNNLTVTGHVVVLQGPQVATSDRLTYNTVTGAMVMSTEPGGRVRGLFAGEGSS